MESIDTVILFGEHITIYRHSILDFGFWIVYNTRLVCQHFHIYLCYCNQNAVPPRGDDLEKLTTIKFGKGQFWELY